MYSRTSFGVVEEMKYIWGVIFGGWITVMFSVFSGYTFTTWEWWVFVIPIIILFSVLLYNLEKK